MTKKRDSDVRREMIEALGQVKIDPDWIAFPQTDPLIDWIRQSYERLLQSMLIPKELVWATNTYTTSPAPETFTVEAFMGACDQRNQRVMLPSFAPEAESSDEREAL